MSLPLPPAPIRCGLAGWHYPHWNGLVFPAPRPSGFHPLRFLSGFFDAVEINTSFYQSLRPELTRLWVRMVAAQPRFRFTVKLNRVFTHDRRLEEAEVRQFAAGIRPLAEAGRLGCVLMQFPWSFRFTAENRDYFIRLRRAFHEFALVAEMRHSSWMSEEALGAFIDYHVGFVNLDQPEHVKAMPPTAFLTSSIGYARLHGRGRGNWWRQYGTAGEADERDDYLYTAGELEEWRTRVERIRRYATEVYVIANNDAAGKAFVNALQLEAMLNGNKRAAPPGIQALYGDVLDPYVERPRQQRLFPAQAMPRRKQHTAAA